MDNYGLDIEARHPGMSSLRGYRMAARGLGDLMAQLGDGDEMVLSSIRAIHGGTSGRAHGMAEGIVNMVTERTGVLAVTTRAFHYYAPGSVLMRRDVIARTWPLDTQISYSPGYGGGEKRAEFVVADLRLVSESVTNKLPDRFWDVVRLVQSRMRSTDEASEPPADHDLVTRLAQLSALHESGALTGEEFSTAKARLISPL